MLIKYTFLVKKNSARLQLKLLVRYVRSPLFPVKEPCPLLQTTKFLSELPIFSLWITMFRPFYAWYPADFPLFHPKCIIFHGRNLPSSSHLCSGLHRTVEFFMNRSQFCTSLSPSVSVKMGIWALGSSKILKSKCSLINQHAIVNS